MTQFTLAALVGAALFSFVSGVGQAVAQPSHGPGFKLPTMTGKYPGIIYQFHGKDARRLADEVLPAVADELTSASIQEDTYLPHPRYSGLTIDIALKIKEERSICEERHVRLSFEYQNPDKPLIKALTLKNGHIFDHVFVSLYWRNRYFTFPDKSVSPDVALASCRAYSVDTSNWQEASISYEYYARTRQIAELNKAVETLPMPQIHCLDPQGKPCGYERSKLISLVQTAPPERPESLVIPDEGAVTVYRHYGYYDADQIDYVATLRSGKRDLQSLDIRLSKSLPPPAV